MGSFSHVSVLSPSPAMATITKVVKTLLSSSLAMVILMISGAIASLVPITTTTINANAVTGGGGGAKIYDCFTFNGEWDMLQIRVLTTGFMVEKYLVCESDHSFSGSPKPKHLELALASKKYPWLNQVADKFVIRGLTTISKSSWENEGNTRLLWRDMLHDLSATANGKRDGALFEGSEVTERDWVFLSDVDEIWKPHLALELLSPHFLDSTVRFPCEVHYYNYATRHASPMFGTVAGYRWAHYRSMPSSGFRESKGRVLQDRRSGCWHCSYCFGPTLDDAVVHVRNKLQTFSHLEYSGPPWTDTDHIKRHITDRVDLFDRGERFQAFADPDIDAPLIVYAVPGLAHLIRGFNHSK